MSKPDATKCQKPALVFLVNYPRLMKIHKPWASSRMRIVTTSLLHQTERIVGNFSVSTSIPEREEGKEKAGTCPALGLYLPKTSPMLSMRTKRVLIGLPLSYHRIVAVSRPNSEGGRTGTRSSIAIAGHPKHQRTIPSVSGSGA